MHADEAGVNRLSERVIGCVFQVIDTLGTGFLEKVYENALAHELRKAGLAVAQQHGITVEHGGNVVGEYALDLLVKGIIMVELKAIKALDSARTARCLSYLKATGLRLCLLLNFRKSGLRSGELPTDFEAAAVYLRVSACICG
jgi:GxxExxY protein